MSDKRTVVTVQADASGALRAMVGFERVVLLVALAEDLTKLTDQEWRTLRDAEDRRRGRASQDGPAGRVARFVLHQAKTGKGLPV